MSSSRDDVPGATPQNPQILNPPVEAGPFHHFTKLPYDARHLIWSKALEYERVINIQLIDKPKPKRRGRYRLPNYESEPTCDILVERPEQMNHDPMIHPFLVTCSESRHVAKNFYRVRLPCIYKRHNHIRRPGALYLCPEMDIVYIECPRTVFTVTLEQLAEFAKLVYNNDPKCRGLLNLALPANLRTVWPSTCYVYKAMFTTAVHRLERIIFVCDKAIRQQGSWCSWQDKSLPQVRRSIPVCGNVTTFQRLPTDPRAIQDELKHVHTGHCYSNYGYHKWCKFLESLDIEPLHLNVKWSFLLNFKTKATLKITDRESAVQWVEARPLDQSSGEGKDQLPSVVGFWMFPLEPVQEKYDKGKFCLDLTAHPPELYMAHLG